MYPVIHLGPAALQSSVLALLLGVWLGTWIFERECKRLGLGGEQAWDLLGIVALVTMVAGRLAYAGDHLSIFAADPTQLLALTPDTLSLGVGGLFGVFAALAYVQRRRLALLPLLDALAPGALLVVAIFAVGQFLSGDAYGIPSNSPWAILLWGELREPVQLYDALAALTGAALAWRRPSQGHPGTRAFEGVAWYSGARVFLDAFRGDATVLGGGYRTTQVIALGVLLLSLWILLRLKNGEERPAVKEEAG